MTHGNSLKNPLDRLFIEYGVVRKAAVLQLMESRLRFYLVAPANGKNYMNAQAGRHGVKYIDNFGK